MAAKASCGVSSTEMVVVKFCVFMSRSSSFLGSIPNLRKNRRALRHEACVLALERLGYASAPAISDGLGSGIREDILFLILQPIEDALRD